MTGHNEVVQVRADSPSTPGLRSDSLHHTPAQIAAEQGVSCPSLRFFKLEAGVEWLDPHHKPCCRLLCVGQIVWDPSKISLADILRQFWESHDPTQGLGQGNDRGSQYRR